MVYYYLKSAWRHLSRAKALSAINTLGLGTAIAVFLLIFQYARFEAGYDSDKKNTYRVTLTQTHKDQPQISHAVTYGAVGAGMRNGVPGIQGVLRMAPKFGNPVFSYANTHINIERWLFAENSVFSIMNVQLTQGDSATALQKPEAIVISSQLAERFFGKSNPIGKALEFGDLGVRRTFEVTGVFTEKGQSHVKFDALISFVTLTRFFPDVDRDWSWVNFYTYVAVQPTASIKNIEREMQQMLSIHKGAESKQKGLREMLRLQSVPEIHLRSRLQGEIMQNGSLQMVTFLLLIAGSIVVIAWLNYINLSTATFERRNREVGIRKVVGASLTNMLSHHLAETLLLHLISAVAGIVAAEVLIQPFGSLMGKPLPSVILGPDNRWVFLGVYVAVAVLVSGLYPAIAFSRRRAAVALLKPSSVPASRAYMREALVVFQFSTSILFIVATIVANSQIEYLRNKEKGIASQGVLVIDAPATRQSDSLYEKRLKYFKETGVRQHGIIAVSASSSVPGKPFDLAEWRRDGDQNGSTFSLRTVHADAEYATAYGLHFIAGTNFDVPRVGPYHAVILNEKAAKQLGYTQAADAVGQRLSFNGEPYVVQGIIRNFHFASLREIIEPLALIYNARTQTYFTVRTTAKDLKSTIEYLRRSFQNNFAGNAFSYRFLDQSLQEQYKDEYRFGGLVAALSSTAILIACMGLVGLSIFIIGKRTKEIGIRKVLGASVMNLFALLSIRFLTLVIVAFFFAVPFAWWAMQNWLEDFAYRIDLKWWMFLLSGIISFCIALATISIQTLKAAVANPVNSLRSE